MSEVKLKQTMPRTKLTIDRKIWLWLMSLLQKLKAENNKKLVYYRWFHWREHIHHFPFRIKNLRGCLKKCSRYTVFNSMDKTFHKKRKKTEITQLSLFKTKCKEMVLLNRLNDSNYKNNARSSVEEEKSKKKNER
jgi:hypothetical protein